MAVNENKLCFIICTNDEAYLNECLLYIGQLEVPDGYEVENIAIRDASSMTEGYNKAMAMSDAKYKIYMHQDVLIINRRFIFEILRIFKEDDNIGMIGMAGNRSIAMDGAPWSDGLYRRVGELYADTVDNLYNSCFSKAEKPCEDVVVIDGLLMATQYDLKWRDDLFKGWDFYDCSQSLEFIKAGYRVVVPYMERPWCFHDNDVVNLASYEGWRQIFQKEYGDIYYKWTDGYIMELINAFNKNNPNKESADKVTLLIIMGGSQAQNISCVEGLMKYCNSAIADIVAVYGRPDKYDFNYAEKINETVRMSNIHNDFMILESTMVAKDDFISKIIGTMHDNCDVGTVSPLFDNHAYFRMFGATVDEHMREQPRLRSLKVYDSITTLPYALYIRWGLWEKTGGFCAEYTSLYATVVDFQLRALKSGYRNVISLDAFMEVSSKMPIEVISGHDTEVMQRRWGVHYTNNTIGNNYLINMIERLETKPSNILEVGCDMGENLIMLKNLYPDASLYGIELNGNAVEIAKTFANVVQGNIETDIIPFKAVKFDFIIFGDVLEHLRNPEETVRMCREYLTENGRIVSSIPNVQHISILNNLLKGRFPYAEQGLLDKTHIHLFTGYEIMQMFAKTGYTIEEMIFTIYPISAEEQNTLDKLKANFPYTDEKSMKAFQYITCAKKI